jgi:hypothetical protein
MAGNFILNGLSRLVFPHGRSAGSPIIARKSSDFYKLAKEMAVDQFMRTGGEHDAIYYKIVPESQFIVNDGTLEGYSIRLKIFSSPRVGFLNKIPNRMHKIKDMSKVVMYDEYVCQSGMPVKNAARYNPFEYAEIFSVGCVLEMAEKLRASVGGYRVRVMHPYELAKRPSK